MHHLVQLTAHHSWKLFPTAACCAVLALAPAALAGDTKPNIVVILADDLGYGDLACYGGKIPTPHLDRLAADGIRFTDAHTTSSVCTPTRYGLMTGRYNWRSKLKRGVLGGLSPRLIEPNRMTLGSFLQEHGYQTAVVGKWHLGMNWVLKPGADVSELSIEPREQVFNVEYGEPIAEGPNQVGFDYFFGISASLDMVPYTFIENDRVVALPTEDRDFPMVDDFEQGGRTRRGPTAPGFDVAEVLPAIVQKTCGFIEQHAAAAREGKPLFVYVPLTAPHTPIAPTAQWRGESSMTIYADFVMQTDAVVGAILAELEKQQLADDTLVICTSDNGCAPLANFEKLKEFDHHPSGPLRGHKADIFEGGHRVPLIARWPAAIAAGGESQQLVCLTDVLATVADILGTELPDDAGEDSLSFLPVLRGQPKSPRDHLVMHSANGTFAVRRGPWKLILAPDSGGWSAPRPGSPEAQSLPPRQLYRLDTDLGEQQNLLAAHADRADELVALLEQLVAQGRSTPGARQQNFGSVEIEPAAR